MACCTDPTATWIDDFESGEPLAANYSTVTNVALTAGAGDGGSIGVRNTGAYGDLVISTLDLAVRGSLGSATCYNPRAYGFGGLWKFNQWQNSGYFWGEIRKTGIAFQHLSFYIEDNPVGSGTFPADVVVYSANGSIEIARVAQIIPDKTSFHKLEAKGIIPSASGNADGIIEVRVNDVVVFCTQNDDNRLLSSSANDWDTLAVGTLGDFDCLYITNGWYCGQPELKQGDPIVIVPDTDEVVRNPCCGSAGPGGSSTSYDWTTPRLDEPTPPVLHAPGGATPSYTACTTGGAGPTASDPTDPQSLASITDPVVSLDLTLPDATVLKLAQHPIVTPGAAVRTARVLSFSEASISLADLYGRLRATGLRVTCEDTDRVFRGYAVDATNRYLRGQPAVLYAESDTARRLGTAPLQLGRYVVKSYRPVARFQFELELVDPLFSHQSPTSLDRPVPDVTIGDVFGDAPTHLAHVPIPMYYGQYGDDDKWAETPKRIPVGIVPAIGPVGPAESYNGKTWDPYVLCRFASKSIGSIFGSNRHDEAPGTVRWSLDDEGTEFLLPGQSGWTSAFGGTTYRDITAPDGTVYRLTMIYVRQRGSQDHRENRAPIAVNLCGIEATGDGTGTLITDAAEVLRHFCNYVVFSQPTTGNWGAVPTDAGGVAVTNQASFNTVKTTHAARLTGGYPVAWAVRERRTAESYLREFQEGTGIRLGRSRQQLVATTLDDAASLSGLTTFTHASIVAESFELDPSSDEVVNKLSYVYGPEAATRRFSGERRVMTDAGVVADYGETYERVDVELHPIRVTAVADDIMSRRLLRLSREPMYGRFVTDLRATDLDLGQLIRLTHEEGLGASGWTDRVVLVTGISVDPNLGRMRATVLFEDVHDLLVRTGETTVSAIGYHPVGTEGVDAFTVGSESAKTAWRVG